MPTTVDEQPDKFDYAALSREDAASARKDAALIKANMKSIAESAAAIRSALERQKKRSQKRATP